MIRERVTNPELAVVKACWDGNLIVDGRFVNEPAGCSMGFRDVLRWRLGRNPQREEKRGDTFRPPIVDFDPAALPRNSIAWLGHSSFIIDVGGVRFVTDPCFFDVPLPKLRALPCPPEALTGIDYLLISHDHRDHFDRRSVKILVENNPALEALVPLGGGRLFAGHALRNVTTHEAGWWQEYSVGHDVRVIFLPARHWGRRGLNDLNRTLWGGFLIIGDGLKVFFAGDTAFDDRIFGEIREFFGDIDVCLLPVGAYSPRWFMSSAHTDPAEAVQIFDQLGGGIFIPMHYGTFDLSDEPAGEPLRLLRRHVDADKLRLPAMGQMLEL